MVTCLTVRRALVPVLAVTLLSLPAAASAGGAATKPNIQPEPRNERAAQRLADEERALDIYSRATRTVSRRRPSCRPTMPRVSSPTTTDAPQPATLELIAALRRSPGPGDTLPSLKAFSGAQVYVDHVRAVQPMPGVRAMIVPARVAVPTVPSAACRDAEAAEARRRAARTTRGVRRELEQILRDVRADDADMPRPTDPPADGILLAIPGPQAMAVYSGGDAVEFSRRGIIAPLPGDGSRAMGVVPDGVATVDVVFPRRVDVGPLFKPIVYPKAITRTATVQDNVFTFAPPRDALRFLTLQMVWKAADGTVLQRVRQLSLTTPASPGRP